MVSKFLIGGLGFTVLIAALFSAACSTIQLHADETVTPGPYVGTKHAIIKTRGAWTDYDYYGQVLLMAADVPMCFVADTVLLPYDLYHYAVK